MVNNKAKEAHIFTCCTFHGVARFCLKWDAVYVPTIFPGNTLGIKNKLNWASWEDVVSGIYNSSYAEAGKFLTN
jgi:hypothetical protein